MSKLLSTKKTFKEKVVQLYEALLEVLVFIQFFKYSFQFL